MPFLLRNRSDFVYMAPPFIAYYGAYDQGDAKTYLLQTAYDQCRLYRQYLQDSSTNLWKHIELGSWQDNNLWATGNGWAAAGMFRVLQTILLSDVCDSFLDQQNDLLNWIEEIVEASWCYQVNFIPSPPVELLIDNVRYRRRMAPSGISSTILARLRTPLRPH